MTFAANRYSKAGVVQEADSHDFAYLNATLLSLLLLLLLLQKAASHGFFVNLDAVLLKLCGPFLDPGSGVFWKRVDPSYVTLGNRLNFKEVRCCCCGGGYCLFARICYLRGMHLPNCPPSVCAASIPFANGLQCAYGTDKQAFTASALLQAIALSLQWSLACLFGSSISFLKLPTCTVCMGAL
jgi:hypothetical protein